VEATFVPLYGLWLLVVAAVRRALAHPTADLALCGSPIGTAMLSYREHCKFRMTIQGRDPVLLSLASRQTGRRNEKRHRLTSIRQRFLQYSAVQVDHGMRIGASVTAGVH
jgi:hypothetical protein